MSEKIEVINEDSDKTSKKVVAIETIAHIKEKYNIIILSGILIPFSIINNLFLRSVVLGILYTIYAFYLIKNYKYMKYIKNKYQI